MHSPTAKRIYTTIKVHLITGPVASIPFHTMFYENLEELYPVYQNKKKNAITLAPPKRLIKSKSSLLI